MKRIAVVALVATLAIPALAGAKDKMAPKPDTKPSIKCDMNYNMKTWSVVYKEGHGAGKVTCNNGQTADVKLKIHGVGAAFGENKVKNGKGTFSDVYDIGDIYGSYANTAAGAGIVGTAGTQVMMKGKASLALANVGKGFDIDFSFGDFEVKPEKK